MLNCTAWCIPSLICTELPKLELRLEGLHSIEAVFVLPTQPSRVHFSAFPIFFNKQIHCCCDLSTAALLREWTVQKILIIDQTHLELVGGKTSATKNYNYCCTLKSCLNKRSIQEKKKKSFFETWWNEKDRKLSISSFLSWAKYLSPRSSEWHHLSQVMPVSLKKSRVTSFALILLLRLSLC